MSEIIKAKIHGMGYEIVPYLAGIVKRLNQDQEYVLEMELFEIHEDLL
jgi:hypothetical protein